MYHFIVNRTAGSGGSNAVWQRIKSILEKEAVSYKVYFTEYKGHAEEITKSLFFTEGKIDIVLIGGDGTLNEVINGISDFSRTRVGIVSAGSGNDFVRGLGIKTEPEEMLYDILKEEPKASIDLGFVTWNEQTAGRYFAISSGTGLDALVCRKANTTSLKKILNRFHLGKFTYMILTISSVFGMRTYGQSYSYDKGNQSKTKRTIFTAVMNLPKEGGGVPMAPEASVTDGKLNICSASNIPGPLVIFCFLFLVLGKQRLLRPVRMFACGHLSICTDAPVVLHADGEFIAEVQKVQYSCRARILTLLNTVPRK